MISRRHLLASPALVLAARAHADATGWGDVVRDAQGSMVAFHAWAGDDRTNAFIAWAGERMRMLHHVSVQHVRLSDTVEAVSRVVAERAAGHKEGGSVDLIWLNGAHFLAMMHQGLLYGPMLDRLPNADLIDRAKPTLTDFTEPTDGYEVPWRMAQMVMVYDSARVQTPPESMKALVGWAATHPGRLTHPVASDAVGATFLKQALVELAPDAAVLQRPVTKDTYAAAIPPLWAWYNALRPSLWRGGTDFPANGPVQAKMLKNGELDLFMSFNPAEAANGIATSSLPATVRACGLKGGTLGHCSFIAIPFNAAHRPAAMVLADFLLSPEAQAHAADPHIMGSPTVLDLGVLSAVDRALFNVAPMPGLLTADELGPVLPEPHASWTSRLAKDWERRVIP